MQNWFEIFLFVFNFTSTIMLVMLIALVNIGLRWLPSRNKISLFLLLFLINNLVGFFSFFISRDLNFKIYVCTLPIVLLLGPLMTRFTESTLLMQKTSVLDAKAIILFFTGLALILPYAIYPHSVTQLPDNEKPWLLVFGVNAFVLLFVVNSSMHFLKMMIKFFRGSLYSVGYDQNTYSWLKGVWISMTFIWLSLMHNLISGIIEIPWEKLNVPWAAIEIITNILEIGVLFSLTILTVLYCKKPPEQPVVELCENSDKYEKSALSESQAKDILQSIDKVMQSDRFFLDSALNIEKLANAINSPSQYLSQAINQYRAMNFYELIANYRIEYAKELLIAEPKKSVMTVAMDAGFNAKSTFNQTFKKITGLTPSEFKKNHHQINQLKNNN
ncbi:MAG: AraC family transcriptional regulator [Colwellia sp.]|nr:AraC family transcriptional regulator [Colwellia sp.]